MVRKSVVLLYAALLAPVAHAQFDFDVAGRPVQIHSFASQGFMYSSDNNYLLADTSQGTFQFTDVGANISGQFTNKLRIGAQVYVRSIGKLGEWHPQLDWAYADYRFTDWFGIRGGKVKTALGLYNDSQDNQSLFTWALLPQSTYPLDLRSVTIAHTGGDFYGQIPLKKAGSLTYTAYAGLRNFDKYGGVYYFSEDQGIPIKGDSGLSAGGDLRWNTPLSGLMLGGSWNKLTESRIGYYTTPPLTGLDFTFDAAPDQTTAIYGDFTRGNWHFDGEFRREHYYAAVGIPALPGFIYNYNGSNTGWFLSVAYRVSKWLEVGTYHSRYFFDDSGGGPLGGAPDPNADHIFDQAATARFDITRWWNFKVEGHFMNGYGDVYSAHGFYSRSNANGLKPDTNMLVLRTGVSF
ncbi:MAG TPA: hypothetical protein VFW44_11200 [Bryobacteraceae bacterium]|nr:hypothetical protein [Bryobacteraceae bacterium]